MDEAFVGETVVLYPLWAAEDPPRASTYTVQLIDTSGELALAVQHPLSERYPPKEWPPGAIVRDRVEMFLPAHLAAGTYTWAIEIDRRDARAGELDVHVPVREHHIPPDIEPVGEVLDGFAELVGYQLAKGNADELLGVTLYWRAREETATNYKVFVQLLGADGQVTAQSDAVPATWARPTTSWLPPEAIEDVHQLHVPANRAPGNRLIVGLYEPRTGRRATGTAGTDHILLDIDDPRTK
jgi:hypothetical protein